LQIAWEARRGLCLVTLEATGSGELGSSARSRSSRASRHGTIFLSHSIDRRLIVTSYQFYDTLISRRKQWSSLLPDQTTKQSGEGTDEDCHTRDRHKPRWDTVRHTFHEGESILKKNVRNLHGVSRVFGNGYLGLQMSREPKNGKTSIPNPTMSPILMKQTSSNYHLLLKALQNVDRR
jgi:hypothetical protein